MSFILGNISIVPSPLLEVIEGDSVIVTCQPISIPNIMLLVNGEPSNSSFVEVEQQRNYQLGPADRSDSGTTFQCVGDGLSSSVTTLNVFCKSV